MDAEQCIISIISIMKGRALEAIWTMGIEQSSGDRDPRTEQTAAACRIRVPRTTRNSRNP